MELDSNPIIRISIDTEAYVSIRDFRYLSYAIQGGCISFHGSFVSDFKMFISEVKGERSDAWNWIQDVLLDASW